MSADQQTLTTTPSGDGPSVISVAAVSHETHLDAYVQLAPAHLSTSTISTSSSPPSLCPPSLQPVRRHSASFMSLNTPEDEDHDPISVAPHCSESIAPIYRGRFVELMEQDWEFQDEDREHDESFEIIALPRASTSSEGTTSTAPSGTYKALPFIRRHRSKGPAIAPSFSTSRLLATFGKKSRAIWGAVKEKDVSRPLLSHIPSVVTMVDYPGAGQAPLSTIAENTTSNLSPPTDVGLSRTTGSKFGLSELGGSLLTRRLSLRRRHP